MSTPAGWYDDGSGRQRWWNGVAWTDHFADAPPPAPVQTQAAAPYSGAPASTQPFAAQPTNGMAVTALVLGLLGFGIIAAIFGHIALSQITRNPAQSGRGMAIAGLVLGYLVAAVVVIWLILALFVLTQTSFS